MTAFTLKSHAQQHASAADMCTSTTYAVKYVADYEGKPVSMAHNVSACDAEDAEREAKRQCRRDGGSNIRDITARFIGRAK